MLSRRTSLQSFAKGALGFSQLRVQALHASCKASSAKPGSKLQSEAIHRLLVCTMMGCPNFGKSTSAAVGTLTEACRGAGLLQAAKIPTIKHHKHRMRPRMLLLLLEALGAGLIFIAIIWWTMFSGRKNGELPEADPEDKKRL